MGVNNYTVMICTAALKQDTNNMWRGLTDPNGEAYDNRPVDSANGVHSVPLAVTLNATSPWLTTATHWMAGGWTYPDFPALVATLKAGNIPTRDWLPFNLTQNRARAAGQALYSKTVIDDGTRETYLVVEDAISQALAETGLKRVPSPPI